MPKNYVVRLKCPHGDDDQWVILQDRSEPLSRILDTPWDFECPVHGVQREMPIEAKERIPSAPSLWQSETRPAPQPPAQKLAASGNQRLSKRVSLHLPVLAYGWTRGENAFHEETSSLLVSASGGLLALRTRVAVGDTVFLVNKATEEERECRVAYVGPGLDGKLRVGVAFKRPSPGFWRSGRNAYRMAKAIKVTVRGVDRKGDRFKQSASAVDISRNGARLDGVGYLTWPGETVEVKRGWRKARFRVVWVGDIGTPQAGQAGIVSMDADSTFWGVALA